MSIRSLIHSTIHATAQHANRFLPNEIMQKWGMRRQFHLVPHHLSFSLSRFSSILRGLPQLQASDLLPKRQISDTSTFKSEIRSIPSFVSANSFFAMADSTLPSSPIAPSTQMPKERYERYQVIKDLRIFATGFARIKELFTEQEGVSSSELFERINHLKIQALDGTHSLEKLNALREEYKKLLIQPMSMLNEAHFQDMKEWFQSSIPLHCEWIQNVEEIRKVSVRRWLELVNQEGMKLGRLKQVSHTMMGVLSHAALIANGSSFHKVRKALVVKQFVHFFNKQPLLKDVASNLSEKLFQKMEESAHEAQGQLTFSMFSQILEEFTNSPYFTLECTRSLFVDLNSKVKEVDQQLVILELLSKKDKEWLEKTALHNEKRIRESLQLMHEMATDTLRISTLLNEYNNNKLSEDDLLAVQTVYLRLKAKNIEMENSFKELLWEYWQHQKTAFQSEIKKMTKSSYRKEAIDSSSWSHFIRIAKDFFNEVAIALKKGEISQEVINKQNEFLPEFLDMKQKIGEVEKRGEKKSLVHAFFLHSLSLFGLK